MQSDIPYPIRNSLGEMERLDLLYHTLFRITGRKNHVSLESVSRVLDIGAGTCAWMLDAAPDFPQCIFYALDIERPQPQGILPNNCKIDQGNFLKGLPYPNEYFGYIRQYFMDMAIPYTQWSTHMQECARVLMPGAWIELCEIQSISDQPGPMGACLIEWLRSAMRTRNLDISYATVISDLLDEAGMIATQTMTYTTPLGSRGGEVGMDLWRVLEKMLCSLAPLIAQANHLTEAQVMEAIRQFKEEVEQEPNQLTISCFIAQKPYTHA